MAKRIQQLEEAGSKLYIVRGALMYTRDEDENLGKAIKKSMKNHGMWRYPGRNVIIETSSRSSPKQVDPNVASQYVSPQDLLAMISIDRKKFVQYLKDNDIVLDPGEYLVSPGTVSVIKRPIIKLAANSIKAKFRSFCKTLEQEIL